MYVKKFKPLYLILFITLLLSLAFPGTALADDETPPSGDPPVVQVEEGSVDTQLIDGQNLVLDPTEAVSTEDTFVESNPEQTSDSEEIVTEVVEVLAETDSVLLDENGETLPLAAIEAAEALQNNDPYIVRAGVTYRFLDDCTGQPVDANNTCTVSTTPIQAAIDFALAGETVNIESGNYTEDVIIAKQLTLVGLGLGATTNSFTLNSGADTTGSSNIFASLINVVNGAKIQNAIDLVLDGGTVNVFPGDYDEVATNRKVLGTNGPHQFGLFIDKDDVTVQGVTAGGTPITDYASTLAYITTNATNNFGYSGIFVQGDNVTLSGLHIGPNTPSDNKTIEVIGDGFNLYDSWLDIPGGGSLYFGDWRFDTGTNTSYIQSYDIEGNLFDHSTSLDLTNGAGYSGAVTDRIIYGNDFNNSDYWPSISFNGSGTGVPWFVYSVGGAQIWNNSFNNTYNTPDNTSAHIRARGTYDNTQFDWASYWYNNTYNKAVIVTTNGDPSSLQTYNYTSGTYSFNTVRRIGVTLQGEINHAVAGDTVLVAPGNYNESPSINKSLTLESTGGQAVTVIDLQTGPTYLGSLSISGSDSDVTVNGFTIVGNDAVGAGLASSNIFLFPGLGEITITNNTILVGNIGPGSNGDDGIGLLTTYNLNPALDVPLLTVTGNTFEPLNATGWRAFYINPGVNLFVFDGNEINGNFGATAITQAKDGTVSNNIVTGTGSSAGLGTWGYPDPNLYGMTDFLDNTITGTGNAISLFETNNIYIEGNIIENNGTGIRAVNSGWVGGEDADTIVVFGNSFAGNSNAAITNGYPTGAIMASDNWWGDASGPLENSAVADACGLLLDNPSGSGDYVTGCVIYEPWLTSNPFGSPPIPPAGDGGSQYQIPRTPGLPLSVPVTSAQEFRVSCDIDPMVIQLEDIQVILTGLCGYVARLDLLVADGLPGDLPEGDTLLRGLTLTLLKDGVSISALPVGASVQIIFPAALGGSILKWNESEWMDMSTAEDLGTFVLVNP